MGAGFQVLDEGTWFVGVVTKTTGSQCFIQKDGEDESFACPGDFEDIKVGGGSFIRHWQLALALALALEYSVAILSTFFRTFNHQP